MAGIIQFQSNKIKLSPTLLLVGVWSQEMYRFVNNASQLPRLCILLMTRLCKPPAWDKSSFCLYCVFICSPIFPWKSQRRLQMAVKDAICTDEYCIYSFTQRIGHCILSLCSCFALLVFLSQHVIFLRFPLLWMLLQIFWLQWCVFDTCFYHTSGNKL